MHPIRSSLCFALVSTPLLLSLSGCSSSDSTQLLGTNSVDDLGNGPVGAPNDRIAGSAQFRLTLPTGVSTEVVEAHLVGPGIDQLHSINVAGDADVSMYVGGLAPGQYTISLTATLSDGLSCEGSSTFGVVADQTQRVSVQLICPAGGVTEPSGSASVGATFTFEDPDEVSCEHIERLVASVHRGPDGPGASLHVHLAADVTGETVSVTLADGTPLPVTAPCEDGDACTDYACGATSGPVALDIAVTADASGVECTESGRVVFTCPAEPAEPAEPLCGNGIIESGEVCDTEALPPGSPASATCSDDCLSVDPGAPARASYTFGHADLAFELSFDDVAGEWDVHLLVGGGTVDGAPGVDATFGLDDVQIVSDAFFVRPDPDSGFFEPLCVAPGESVYWLPQNNTSASNLGVPFLGIENGTAPGLMVGDVVELSLVDVQSPSGNGAYSLWKDGFPPVFSLSSCDGIDATDTLLVPAGHDHFNMGFSPEPGAWTVTYQVHGELVAGGDVSVTFDVHFLLE